MKENLKVSVFCTVFPASMYGILKLRHIMFPDWFVYPFVIVLLTGFLSIVCPIAGSGIYKIAKKYGKIVGEYIAKIILFIVFVLTVFPLGMLMKAVKRDRLRLNKTNPTTYWIENEQKATDYEYQF